MNTEPSMRSLRKEYKACALHPRPDDPNSNETITNAGPPLSHRSSRPVNGSKINRAGCGRKKWKELTEDLQLRVRITRHHGSTAMVRVESGGAGTRRRCGSKEAERVHSGGADPRRRCGPTADPRHCRSPPGNRREGRGYGGRAYLRERDGG